MKPSIVTQATGSRSEEGGHPIVRAERQDEVAAATLTETAEAAPARYTLSSASADVEVQGKGASDT